MAEKKIDPFDIEALERSLNDSATRVSTIWISFLIFSLYLLITAATVTHRQLFLAEPVKLPVLNIDLPLWGFFFLAPILFVIFHAYVLIQVILLARTAAAYSEAVDKCVEDLAHNARVRQRLGNTLFAQIFAGSPRERKGWLGRVLRAMAWVTLAIAPVLVLLVFQFAFLPYQSHLATWAHRFLVLIELVAVFWVWPLILNPRLDFNWSIFLRQAKRVAYFPVWLLSPWERRQFDWRRFRHNVIPATSTLLIVLTSLLFCTFPGEPHISIATGNKWGSVNCDGRLARTFDRLELARVDVVDDHKLDKIKQAGNKKRQSPIEMTRTQYFADRNLRCANLDSADLRYVDFIRADLSGATLASADLEGTDFGSARLRATNLSSARLQWANFAGAEMEGANLEFAEAEGAFFSLARLQGATLNSASMQGADFSGAQLQGATIEYAHLQATNFLDDFVPGKTTLSGVDFFGADLRGSRLARVRLQGANLSNANLQGADFSGAQLQGANLDDSNLSAADFSNVDLWRSSYATCEKAEVVEPRFDAIIDLEWENSTDAKIAPIAATPGSIEAFIDETAQDIPASSRGRFASTLRERLNVTMEEGITEWKQKWSDCATKARTKEANAQDRATFLIDLACGAGTNQQFIFDGIQRYWIPLQGPPDELEYLLSRGLLGLDGRACAPAESLPETSKNWLRILATRGEWRE